MKFTRFLLLVVLIFIFSLIQISAHTDGESEEMDEKTGIDWFNPLVYIIISVSVMFIFVLFIVTIGKDFAERNKKLSFLILVVPIFLASLYLAGSTVYGNILSETDGPVHWHADYQIWACGEKLDLTDPQGFKNKIGTTGFHEHNDDRIHFEDTPKKISDINLKNYFSVIGGELYQGHLRYPTNNGIVEYTNNDACPGEGPGKLKVYINGKLEEHFEDYIIYPDPNVPPGDCIIIVFDSSNSEKTNLICDSWNVQGWDYDSFEREEVKIGSYTWR